MNEEEIVLLQAIFSNEQIIEFMKSPQTVLGDRIPEEMIAEGKRGEVIDGIWRLVDSAA